MCKTLFVVGTGTDVGKTFVTALLLKVLRQNGRRAAYYKAAMSGNRRDRAGMLIPGDAAYVKEISGIGQSLASMCPYVYERAYSPHLAARFEGDPVDPDVVLRGYAALMEQYEYVTVEGSGGIVCPLRRDGRSLYLADVVRATGAPSLLVADAGLGAINAVVLTAEYMQARGLRLQGIVLNRFVPGDAICEDNAAVCEQLTGLPVVARVTADAKDFPVAPEFLYEARKRV